MLLVSNLSSKVTYEKIEVQPDPVVVQIETVHAGATPEVVQETEVKKEEVIKKPVKAPTPLPDTDVVATLTAILGEGHPLIAVARCESGYRQFNADGTLLRGKQNPQDVGVLQVNEKYHLAESIRLGYDIHTLEGNIRYGEYLYNHQGLTPWNWSRPCWGK